MYNTTDKLSLQMYLDCTIGTASEYENVKVTVGSNDPYASELSSGALNALNLLYQIKGKRTPAEILRFTGMTDEIVKKVHSSQITQSHGLRTLSEYIAAVQQAVLKRIMNGLEELCEVGLVGKTVKNEGRYVAYAINHGRFVNSYVASM